MSSLARRSSGGFAAAMAIARRDLVEFVRDRRTLFITLMLPMATYPILALSTALGLRTASSEIEAQQVPTKIVVAVSGQDADALAVRMHDLWKTADTKSRAGWPAAIAMEVLADAEARKRLAQGNADFWIEAAAGCTQALDADDTVAIPVHLPADRPSSRRARDQFEAVIRSLADDARARRIAGAGLPASVLEPVVLRFDDQSENSRASPAVTIMPTLAGGVLVLLAVLTLTGGFYPAIDAIAGEKERGTIETLLIAPCSAHDIVLGKFIAVFAVTLATLVVNVASIAATAAVARRFLPAGISMELPAGAAGAIVVTVLAFAALAALSAATCLAVTTASKSGKEAQNTLTPVILLVSALSGTALLPGMRSDGPLAAVPFAGQVAVARSVFTADEAPPTLLGIAVPLAATMASSILLTWLLLRATAALLTDEDILFRGPDVAGGGLARPVRRQRPNVVQGVLPIVAGLAALWYVQGITPADLLRAIPLQQAAAVILPLVAIAWWQRVDNRLTFGLAWPGGFGGRDGWWRGASCLAGAAAVGAGIFVIGATALLAVRGTALSAEAKLLTEKLLALMQSQPRWVAWGLMALLPAVCEEFLFRGWVLTAFAGKARTWDRVAAAVVAQAFCFAIFHLLPERMPQTFFLGIVLGWITIASGSLLPAIVCHIVHNSMPLVLLSTGMPDWAVPAAVGCTAVGAALVALGSRRPSRMEPLA
jgi:sodium transport system permease protein